MNERIIQVNNLTKYFGAKRAVDGLSFEVQRGEVFGLLGHNGAGKSTAIDLLLGLKTPDEGTARIFGTDASKHRKQVFERVGVQLQTTNYQNAITVEEACIEYASLYANPADYARLLESFGLTALKRSFVSKLSGGERQKLSVILALMEKAGCVCALPEYCFTCYPEPCLKDEGITAEICEAVTKAKRSTGKLRFKTLPETSAACIFHRGSYNTLPESYERLLRYIEDNGYGIAGEVRESYIDGVWNREDERDWLSEIQIPLKPLARHREKG